LKQYHSWATGGSNDHEFWGPAQQLGSQLDDQTEESCTTYNEAKLMRNLFQLNVSTALADWYERSLFNGLIGNMNRLNPYNASEHVVGFIYMLPLGGSGLTKPWGASTEGFPCCWGTLSETFAKLGDSIWFASPDASTLYLNLFASNTLTWAAHGAIISQSSPYPASTQSTTDIYVGMAPGASENFTLAIRVPSWAAAGGANVITVNGLPWTWTGGAIVPGTYALIQRTWTNGDSVHVYYPASVRWEPVNDNRAQFAGVGAIMYGGMLLAGLGESNVLQGVTPANVSEWVVRTSDSALNFTAITACGNISLIPLANIMFESYSVYFDTSPAAAQPIGFNASGYSTVPGSSDSFVVGGGATVLPNGDSMNIRSGDPNTSTTAYYATAVQDATHAVTSVSFSYQYVSGYGPAGAQVGANFSLVLLSSDDSCGQPSVVATLYSSPDLTQYPYDVCNTCYSPPQNVSVAGLNLPVVAASQFAFFFQNNDRNLQLQLPMDLTIQWAP
jgi:hypothetical protein